MPENLDSTLALRRTVLGVCTFSVATTWLQTVFETLIARGAVLTPSWWFALEGVAMLAVLILAVTLAFRRSGLATPAWAAFALSLGGFLYPGFA
jgi:hypothetical protein